MYKPGGATLGSDGTRQAAPQQRAETSSLSRLDERFGLTSGCSFVSGRNAVVVFSLQDGSRREFLDFTSVFGSVNFGHRNPHIECRLQNSADLAGFCYPREADQLADWLCRHFGTHTNARVLFQVGGSSAVSTALAIARRARPGRIMAIGGGFHGLGSASQSVTSVQLAYALQRTSWTEVLGRDVVIVEPGATVESWKDVSCLIYEPVQGANGYVPLPAEWLRELERSAKGEGVITIADQIQAGFYRHGVLNKARALGLNPAINLCSKSLTNGMYPLSAVVYPAELEPDLWQPFLAHTFQTATFGYEAGTAVADYIDKSPLEKMALDIENVLRRFADKYLNNGGEGAFKTHISGPTLSFQPMSPAREIVRSAFSRGLLLCSGGASFERIRVAPPLTIGREHLLHGLDLLAGVLERESSEMVAR